MTLRVTPDEIVAKDTSGLLGVHPSWCRVKLSDVAAVQNGHPFPSAGFSREQGVPLLRIRDVGNDSPDTFFDGDVDPEYLVRVGDIVVGMDGDFRAARWNGPTAALNQRVCRIIPKSEAYSPRFLFVCLQPYLDAVNKATSAVTVKHLSSRTVQDLPLPLPPLAEQERIVTAIEEKLSLLDAGEASLLATRTRLKRLRDSLLVAAVTGQLVPQAPTPAHAEGIVAGLGVLPPGDAGLPALPPRWRWDTLAGLARDAGYGTSVRCGYDESGVGVLRIPNIQSGGIDLNDLKRAPGDVTLDDRLLLDDGDLLIVRTNGSRELIGRSAPVTGALGYAFASYLIRYRLRKEVADVRFVALMLGAPWWRARIEAGAASSAGQYNLSLRTLGPLPVALPPREEQIRIVAEVDRQFSFIEAAERAVSAALVRSAGLRRSVLKAAFEGRLVPQDPSDEPASVLLERIDAERAAAPKMSRRGRTKVDAS